LSTVEVAKNVIYVAGLPRSGSTLMCQLFAHHPEVYCPGHSSPLAHIVDTIRRGLSNDSFLLSQLDNEFDLVYQRIQNGLTGFINGWFAETDKQWVVDKNRSWLNLIETLNTLDGNFRMIVCVRELNQLYGSLEAQHQSTILLDTEDGVAGHTRYGRACQYFNGAGLVARCLTGVRAALEEIPEDVKKHILYVKYERLVSKPVDVMMEICEWLGLPAFAFNPKKLAVITPESDSHYRFKYPHRTYSEIRPQTTHKVPERIRKDLLTQYDWYYRTFYPKFKKES
jgi:sulfotransferase